MASYSIGDFGRRDILKMFAVLAGSGAVLPAKRHASARASEAKNMRRSTLRQGEL